MDENKRQRYEKISIELTKLVGGKDNIQGVAHCATRLRIVLKNNDIADLKAIEDVDLAKGVFVAGDQVQIIFGAGLVNDVYEVFAEHNNMKNMSLSDLKTVANQKMNPLQRIIKALSDVFVDIMPGILAAALLTGLSGVLGNFEFVKANETLYGINRLINISSGAIFGFLPLAVAYSACKRFGGRPILGIVIGCIMLSNSLADAYAAAQGTVEVTVLHIFGLGVKLVGFQGGIIVALLMGFVTAKLDKFFEKKVPEVIRLLISPLLTTLVGALLLFTIIGPVGRGLSSGITNALVWMTQNLGVAGYAVFSGLQQLVVITGLHHIFGAIEAQLLADTGRNFINPLMSVAIIAQGGAVLGYLIMHRDNAKTKELCIPSFISVLFGITEPALFGINLRYRFPIIGGCIGGALGGVIVYLTNLAALGFGTTVVPGIALADPVNNGYVNYIIAHAVAIAGGFLMTLVLGKFMDKTEVPATTATIALTQPEIPQVLETPEKEEFFGYAEGQMIAIEDVNDETFKNKILGDGVAVIPSVGKVYAPTDGRIISIFDTKHAICFASNYGTEILIHIGVDTVNLQGKYFTPHVNTGDVVKKGQLLIEFDKEQIQKAGYDTVIPMMFTDFPAEKKLKISSPGEMTTDTITSTVYKA
ncbi:PTS transporter subunit IIBCA [Clostridium sp. MD294]|uniref:PTS beta-glucoside transporter subunit IIBCA n=1 Tax=Clostridium sp. MD294 TaxID=97138 RepID=UPI0002CBB94F|nr:PTS transporter subunit IIBCA [Clostridium sp. MD294]USF31349.1 PTS system beta-glucoside-specific EIIBCA component [Clostridium sp. MD294]